MLPLAGEAGLLKDVKADLYKTSSNDDLENAKIWIGNSFEEKYPALLAKLN